MDSNSDGNNELININTKNKTTKKGKSAIIIPIIAVVALAVIVCSSIVLGLIPVYLSSSNSAQTTQTSIDNPYFNYYVTKLK